MKIRKRNKIKFKNRIKELEFIQNIVLLILLLISPFIFWLFMIESPRNIVFGIFTELAVIVFLILILFRKTTALDIRKRLIKLIDNINRKIFKKKKINKKSN